jgi:hypothetical protein
LPGKLCGPYPEHKWIISFEHFAEGIEGGHGCNGNRNLLDVAFDRSSMDELNVDRVGRGRQELPVDNLDRPRVDVITKDPPDPGTNNPSLLLGSPEQGLGTISPDLEMYPKSAGSR